MPALPDRRFSTMSDVSDSSVDEQEGGEENIEMLVFDDNNYQETTLTRLNRLRKAGQFCDVNVEVDGHTLPAHRVILACASKFMFDLFKENVNTGHVKVDNIDFSSFNVLLDYAYTSRLVVTEDKVKTVYKAAVLLKMHPAAQACSQFLAEHLNPLNCLKIRAFANRYCDEQLTSTTDAFIQEHIEEVMGTQEIKSLPFLQVDVLGVDDQDRTATGVSEVCKQVVSWLQVNLHNQPLEELGKHLMKLYLGADNMIRDLYDTDDEHINASEEIIDYKRAAKRRQIMKNGNSKEQAPVLSPVRQQPPRNLVDRQLSFEKEWHVVAFRAVSERSHVCIAVLDNTLCKLSIILRAMPMSNNASAAQSEQGSPSPNNSPRNSICQSLEKTCALIPLPRMSSPRCALAVATQNNKLIAIGGYDRGECLKTCEVYDPETNLWSEMASMNVPRGRFDAAQFDQKIYACGGSDGQVELRSAEFYDPQVNKWRRLPDMHYSRSSCGVAVLNAKVYAIGGWSGQTGHSDCEVYDPATNSWSSIAPLLSGRAQTGVCAFDGKLLAVGGNNSWTSINTVEVYDPEMDAWMKVAPMTAPRRGAGIVVFKGKVYVVGGNDGQSSLASTEIYDPDKDVWTAGPTMSMPRANVACIVIKNRLWAVGGFNGKSFLDSMEYLSADAHEWCSYMPVKSMEGEVSEEEGVKTPTTPATPVRVVNGKFSDSMNAHSDSVNDAVNVNGFNNNNIGQAVTS